MKPAFALSFSTTGITLHHHSDDDWFVIGTIPLDVPDLSGQMQALREKAFALENDLSCTLVLPDDQVRYLQLSTEGFSAEDKAEHITRAVADATPYALSELSYDSQSESGTTYVAAVAIETLSEARTFASEHGFVPVAFSAEENKDAFPREVLFSEEPNESEPVPPERQPSPEKTEPEQAPIVDGPEHPLAHPIAGVAAPDTFRAPEATGKKEAAAKAEAKRYAIPAFAAVVLIGAVVGAWLASGSDNEADQAELSPVLPEVTAPEPVAGDPPQPLPEIAGLEPQKEVSPSDPATEEAPEPLPEPAEVEADAQPALTATDEAILEALKVAPTPVESVAQDPETQEAVQAAVGVSTTPPVALDVPEVFDPEELYVASLDNSDLFGDAVALPQASSFDTDEPFDQDEQPSVAGTRFDLDGSGLVEPSPEGTLNPDGIVVFRGRPSKVPPEAPVRFEEEPVIDEIDQRLAGIRPKGRPSDLVESFERSQLGGRSREELATKRPKARPESLQVKPEVDDTPTALAVVRVPRPKVRPAGLVVASAPKANNSNLGSTAAISQKTDDAGSFEPKTVAPKIPSTASVARQATIDNAINLRRLNLIGVYGTPANRRALVRLPSGRYKKLKVGDRIDGGKVIAISDSELRYQKKGRNVTLAMPRS